MDLSLISEYLAERFVISSWIFDMLRWFISETCSNISFINEENNSLYSCTRDRSFDSVYVCLESFLVNV